MNELTNDIEKELVSAIDDFITIAHQLIDKLIRETDQPEKSEIEAGHYYEIQNADLFNGQTNLSDNWWFDVHGEHCLFKNMITNQTLEVSLGNKESIGNLDPYFFYHFLETTEKFKHLTCYFEDPFSDTLAFFEKLTQINILTHTHGVHFRKTAIE